MGEEFHQACRGKRRGEEGGGVAGGAGDGLGGETSAADGTFHGGGPAGKGPVAGEEEAVTGGFGCGAKAIEAGGNGEGGARFFEDAGLEQLGIADLRKEAGEFDQREGEDLL